MKSPAERKQEQRDAKLEEIQREVEAGSLVVRKMTSAEREKYPPKEPRPRRGIR
jgi:hypothetical protein